jgi:hypothetical protein
VNILLQAVDRLGKDVEYYAVDLSLPELKRTFGEIPTGKQLFHGYRYCREGVGFISSVPQYTLFSECGPDLHEPAGVRVNIALISLSPCDPVPHVNHPPRYLLTKHVEGYKHVKCFGLYGTYDDALEWLKTPEVEAKPKTILWLGSSLGNFKRHEVPPFLAGFGAVLQTGDTMLIGIDSCKDPEVRLLPRNACNHILTIYLT